MKTRAPRSFGGYRNAPSSNRFVKRDIAGLIRTCEANYVRMITLLPDIDELLGRRDRLHRLAVASDPPSGGERSFSPRDILLISRVVGAQDLYLRIIEHRRYTTVVNLTYRLSPAAIDEDCREKRGVDGPACEKGRSRKGLDEGRGVLEPNARIHIYHDARAAELISQNRRSSFRLDHDPRSSAKSPSPTPELERKWRMNRFLMKWLGFCLHQGHIFLPGLPGMSHLP
ncbi:DUF1249 domain-containing protein [Thioalkalivibrio sp. HK1]|uniref:DUF1249 domain-containing protein n=1 Tax=Thioalkalivibrio sp. HK1 TaxID=1469245 RepID=UPI0004B6B66C|nr:DUF1249 domain-containing protein [Thioalkalivibrio sp. HK1]